MDSYGNDGATLGLSHTDPVMVGARLLGVVKPIEPSTSDLISRWEQVSGSSLGRTCTHEVLVVIGSSSHWLVACEAFAVTAGDHHPTGAAIPVEIRFIGRVSAGGKERSVFIVV